MTSGMKIEGVLFPAAWAADVFVACTTLKRAGRHAARTSTASIVSIGQRKNLFMLHFPFIKRLLLKPYHYRGRLRLNHNRCIHGKARDKVLSCDFARTR